MSIDAVNPPKFKLPPLRQGITFSFSDYDSEGKPQWLIHDSGRNKFFIIGWVEYEILLRWSLGGAELVVDSVNSETTLHVELEDVEHVLRFLAHNYLIKQSGYQIYQAAKEQKLFKKDNLFHWLISYYLFFRVPLLHPDKFLERTKWVGTLVFSRMMLYIMSALAIISLYQLSTQWDRFTHTFSTIFTLQGLFYYFIAYMICKLLHELGHAYMCKQYGVSVPTLGVAFLVFWPVLYTDTTLSWTLNSNQRLRIALGGIWVETYVTIIAALIWCNVDNQTLQAICYVTITINWMASLLINASPFMRFDGYYILSDYLKMPNLQPRAFALTRWQIRRWLFDWSDPPPEKFISSRHHFLVAYSIVTWLYRLVVYFGIALLVYHFAIKIVGIVLFGVELFYFIIGPFVSEIGQWISQRNKFSFNAHTIVTVCFATVVCALFFLPIHETLELPATLSYQHQFLIAPAEGILETSLPIKGTHVAAMQPIVKIVPEDLSHEIRQVMLDYEKKMIEFRRASINKKQGLQKGVILSDMTAEQAKYSKLMHVLSKFTLSVPFDGVVAEIAPELSPGTVVMTHEWLGDVINPNVVHGEAYVSQSDFNKVQVGLPGYFYPEDITESPVAVTIRVIEVLNSNKLNCYYAGDIIQEKKKDIVVKSSCYHANTLGGEIAVYSTEEGDLIPVNSIFRIEFSANKPVQLNKVERGTLVIRPNKYSLAQYAFFKVKTIMIQQSGF